MTQENFWPWLVNSDLQHEVTKSTGDLRYYATIVIDGHMYCESGETEADAVEAVRHRVVRRYRLLQTRIDDLLREQSIIKNSVNSEMLDDEN